VLLLTALLVGCRAPLTPPGTPTPLPIVANVRSLPQRGIGVEGAGSARTVELVPDPAGGLPYGIVLLTLTHAGRSTFVASALQGGQAEVISRAIGEYRGRRPLVVQGAVTFEVIADGGWTLTLEQMQRGGQPAFSGSGDDVSAYFEPPPAGSWTISHTGQSSFIVYAHCGATSNLVADRPGSFQDTVAVEFSRGPCFWEVRADGDWNLQQL